MAYLLKDIFNNYYSLNSKIEFTGITETFLKYGFTKTALLTADKDFLKGKRLVSDTNIASWNVNTKDSYDFILLELDYPIPNLYLNDNYKVLTSKDGITWVNFIDNNTYFTKEFNISLNSFVDVTEVQKKELSNMKDYIMKNAKEVNYVGVEDIKYVFIFLDKNLDRLNHKRTIDPGSLVELDDINIDMTKTKITVTNNLSINLDNLIVNMTSVRSVKKDTLEEF